ncbi:hypothetical protein PsorP6_004818 [Peronosclerospora sorghi]|uniref:Uncharacterized protein n=1 Tax=Peronosclerospora sorghi TaxID=230839 RepID=A0ACC0VR70_9STRA|nr:hypothetical protein PsorP6_004818 [Peronosclerospora sorghi]
MENCYLLAAMAVSAAGTCLMPTFGLLFRFQPQFARGLLVRAIDAEANCYIIGAVYAAVFLLCGLLLALKTSDCFDMKQEESDDEITRRNERFKLPFSELESEDVAPKMWTP